MHRCPPRSSGAIHDTTARPLRSWEGTPVPDWRFWLASTLVAALAAFALGAFVDRVPEARGFFVEDGPVEMVQAAMLLGIAAIFAVAFARSGGSRAFFCILAAYACIFAVTREIPRCGSAFVGGNVCLPTVAKRSIVLLASALGLVVLVLRPIEWRGVFRLSNLRWVWPSAIVLSFLVAAEALESLIYYSEVEEFLEFAAYLHLAVFAAAILRGTWQRSEGWPPSKSTV